MKKQIIGSFEIKSGKVIVSDPCYDLDTWCNGELEKVSKGIWNAKVYIHDERCAFLIAWHEKSLEPNWNSRWFRENFTVGVDSGQAGIYDVKHFKDDSVFEKWSDDDRLHNDIICDDDPWYSWNCDRTLCGDMAGVIPFGCVSSSGYGDGSYTCHTKRDRNKVVAIMINFHD